MKPNKKNDAKKVLILSLTIAIIILLIGIAGFAYAKYVTSAQGTATAQVANMICTIDVKSSSEDQSGNVINPSDQTIVNPYCIVTIKDYTGEEANPTAITQTDVNYTVTVTPKQVNGADSFTLPAYYWYEIASPDATSGTKIATSTALNSASTTAGSFKNGVAATRYYKIVFLNSGEEDITRYVDFDLKAVQAKDN
ncbi:MAG: hypothetical protein IJ690_05095 [Clostridia bacterium]|nr:hypothetical protein [Clostridia bacterium]